jgi:plasmid stabilization system protein ParE
MWRLNLTDSGKQDIREIGRYIFEELHSPIAAVNTVKRIDEAIKKIPDNPYIYPKVRDDRLAAMGYRAAVIRSYMAFFMLDEDKKIISVDRVLYGKRDWRHIL